MLAVALVGGVLISAGSAGTSTKPYTAVFGSSVAGGATNADVPLTIHNLSSNQSLGSANVTAASNSTGAFTITGETGASVAASQTYPTSLLMLRNLNIAPGTSLTVHISVNTPCASGAYTWGIRAKQSNDFNGTGNDFSLQANGSSLTTTISGGCHLAFLTQPASADVNAIITDTAYNPNVTGGAGSPHYVAVELVDSSGNQITSATGTVTLTKVVGTGGSFATADTTASFDSTGVATFSALKSSASGADLRLKAQASGYADSDPSSVFDITTGGQDCTGQPVCSFSTTLTNAQVDTTGTGDFDFIAIQDTTTIPASVIAADGGCEHFIGTGTGFEESDVRHADGSLDFTYSIPDRLLKRAYGPNYGQPNVPLCAGGKVVDPITQQPVDCNPATQTPWMGRHLGTDGKFDGTYRAAVCGADGFWWGILGTRQDPNPPIDPAITPRITAWGTSLDGLSRTFTIHVTPGWDWRTN